MSNVRFSGLDVHKDSIVMSVAETGTAEAKVLGTFPKDINKVLKQLKKLSADVSLLRVCYEAGPTGFGLCRRLVHQARELAGFIWSLGQVSQLLA